MYKTQIFTMFLCCLAHITLAQTTVCFNIESEAEETVTTGSINLTSSDFELGADTEVSTPGLQLGGLRYTNFSLPTGAVVTNADIQFTADESSNGTANISIKGELVGNAPAYSNANFNISNRNTTAATVAWQPAQWTTIGAVGGTQKTPDVSNIITEIISNPAFNNGNAISFIITGTGTRVAENTPIELCVTYLICDAAGTTCNDGLVCTTNDVWDNDCNCAGTPDADSDNDGFCDIQDQCPNFDDNLIGTPCDDGDANTIHDNWQTSCNCEGVAKQVLINEVFLSGFNGSEVDDHGFKIDDWIELYNPSGGAVNLAGWYLSDDQKDLQKWQIPSGMIDGNDHYVFYANGLNDTITNTSFKIDQSELDEEVVLSDPSGNMVDIYKIRKFTQIGHSRGRTTDGDTTWSVFANPTHGAPNSAATEYAPYPEIDIPSGAHSGAVTVTVNVPAGFTARYELNTGDNATAEVIEPSPTSAAYTSPLTFANTTVFKVRLYDDAGLLLPGFLETNTYLIDENHSIYTLSVSGENNIIQLLDGEIDLYPTAHWEFFDETGELVTEVAGNLNKHGQDSWVYPQRGFDIFARDEVGYGGQMKHQFYDNRDRDEFDRFIIRAAGDDNHPYEEGGAHIRDAFVQTWGGESGLEMDHRTYRPCVVYLNGKYWGVYEIREKVVHKSFTEHYYDQKEEDLDYISYWGSRTQRYGSGADWDTLISFINTNNMGDVTNFNHVDSEVNLTSWTDYVLFNNYIVSKDWNNWNSAWWRGRNPDGGAQKWQFILWDMDASFGHYINYSNVPDITPNASPCDVLNNSPISDPEQLLSSFQRLIDQNPAFRDFVANRYNDLLNTYWSCDYSIPLLDEMIIEKEPEMQRQLSRWPVSLGGSNAGDNDGTYAEWQSHVQDIRDFLNARCAVIDDSLATCLDLGAKYQITFQTEPANALAEIQTNSVVLPQTPMTGNYYASLPLELKAQESFYYEFSHWTTQNGTTISNPNDPNIQVTVSQNDVLTAHFIPAASPELVINEIMYNPDNLCTISASDSTELDYIELKNAGTTALNLGNCLFTDGLEYTFSYPTIVQPGDFLVLAENKNEFQTVYGFAPHGQYKGSLKNDGERLELSDPYGNIIDSLTYNDANPWDESPDGGGPSLELLHPSFDNNEALNWFRSDNDCGTPNAENSRICTGTADQIVINEINYNSDNGVTDPGDWVELYNPNAAPVDISDWTFYDNGNEFIFPSGTIIPPDDYLVLVEDDAMFTSIFPHLTVNDYIGDFDFGLSNKGERVSLFNENKCLSDYVIYNDKIPWDTIPDGNGPTLSLITPNSDNALPQSWESSSNINSAYGTPGRANEPCLENSVVLPSAICAGFSAEIRVDAAYSDMDFTWFVSGGTPNNFTTNSEVITWNNPGNYNAQLITKYYECIKVYIQPITVEDCNTTPNIVDDNFSTNEDNVLSDNVLTNDSDPNFNGLIVNTMPQISPTNGTLILNVDGTFDYTPNADFHGTDSFTYEVCDDATFGNTQTLSVSVATGGDDVEELTTGTIETSSSDLDLMNDAPDTYSAIGIRMQNVSIPQGANITNAYLEFVADEAQSVATSLNISAEATGNAAAIPTTNFALSSMTKTSASATWANLPAWTIGETHQSADISPVIQELINRGDWASGNAMTFIIEGTGRRTAESFDGVTPPKLVITYEMSMNVSLCDIATVSINILPQNDAPQATNDNLTTTEDTPKTGNAINNDSDIDGDNLAVNITPITAPQNGSLLLLASGFYSYTPNADFFGTDIFKYEICDDGSPILCDIASVFITINPVNDVPTPVPDNLSMFANSSIQDNVLLNDNDIENDNLRATTTPIIAPSNGALIIQPNGNIDYTPNPNFVGTDSFTYEVCDDGTPSLCNTEVVTIIVEPDCVDIELAAWLEGAFDPALGEMRNDLVATRKLLPGQTPVSGLATPTPAGQPYAGAPWNYAGTEGASWTDADYTGDETDWILVSFRTDIAKNTEVGMTAALLMKDGSVSFPDRCALTSTVASPLYIVVEHRNHIGVMSPQPVDVIGSTLTYDFRLSDSYRDITSFGQKQLPTGEWTMYAGDANQLDFPSFDINGTDKTIWFDNNGVFDYYFSPDFNLDGDINGQDKTLWFDNNGISSRVPK